MVTPDFEIESSFWKKGILFVGGCDEVGRGSLAGPVVAASVIFSHNITTNIPIKINDSKKLTSLQRDEADIWIRQNALSFGIGTASVREINKSGIKKATEIAMRNALTGAKIQINHLLIDAFYIPYVRGLRRKNQTAIIKGDQKSLSIAAASIIAKVFRDRWMINLGTKVAFSKYEWAKNKGYGTLAHQKAILKYGVTPYHRIQFVNTFLSKKATF